METPRSSACISAPGPRILAGLLLRSLALMHLLKIANIAVWVYLLSLRIVWTYKRRQRIVRKANFL